MSFPAVPPVVVVVQAVDYTPVVAQVADLPAEGILLVEGVGLLPAAAFLLVAGPGHPAVVAAASLMLQPLLTYVAGLGRMISFIISAVLITYLIVTVVCKLKGKNCSREKNPGSSKGSADGGTEQGDVEV